MRKTSIAAAVVVGLALAAPGALAGDDPGEKALEALEAKFEVTELQWMKAYEEFLPQYEALAKRFPGTETALRARLRVLKFTGRLRQDDARMKSEAAKLVDGILADFPKAAPLAELTDLSYLFDKAK